MSFNILYGIFLIATGAFSAGSFAVPFDRIKGWQESQSPQLESLFQHGRALQKINQ